MQASDGAVIGEPLTQIGCCGCVLHDQYGEFMDAFAKRRQEHFSYDWRRELGEEREAARGAPRRDGPEVRGAGAVRGALDGLHAPPRGDAPPPGAHPLGDASGTFAGGIGYHFLLARGERIGLNGTLVAPETVATWPCAYAAASPVGDLLLIGDDGTPHWQVLDKAKLKKGEAAPIGSTGTTSRRGSASASASSATARSRATRCAPTSPPRCASASSSRARCARGAQRPRTTAVRDAIGHGYQGEDFFLWDADARTMKECWRGDGLYVHKSSGPPPLEGAPPPRDRRPPPDFCLTPRPACPTQSTEPGTTGRRRSAATWT